MIAGRILAAASLLLVLTGCAPGSAAKEAIATGLPGCDGPNRTVVLIAQSVQTATELPCIAGLPAGWTYAGADIRRGSATYWLSSAILGRRVVEVSLLPSCDTAGRSAADEAPAGTTAYRSTDDTGETRTFVFDGGCVVERLSYPPETDPTLIGDATATLGFLDRADLAQELDRRYGVILCGPGGSPCAGA